MTATGFTDGTGAASAVQPALRIINLNNSMASAAFNDSFRVQVGIPSAGNTRLGERQALRPRAGGGNVLTVTITNSNAAVGQLITPSTSGQTVTVPIVEGDSLSGSNALVGVAFDPLVAGTTTVSATIPGFIATDTATVDVTVTP